jgi:hypothetical protein
VTFKIVEVQIPTVNLQKIKGRVLSTFSLGTITLNLYQVVDSSSFNIKNIKRGEYK